MAKKQVSFRARAFWKRLAQNYGARLAEQYGAQCPDDWCEVVDRTDDERLEQALITIRREHLNFPPTLGQFEAAIPKRTFGQSKDSIPDQLAQEAVRRFGPVLCEHQLWPPWTYFGELVDDGSKTGLPVTKGVTIPGCSGCGKPSHRLLASELPA